MGLTSLNEGRHGLCFESSTESRVRRLALTVTGLAGLAGACADFGAPPERDWDSGEPSTTSTTSKDDTDEVDDDAKPGKSSVVCKSDVELAESPLLKLSTLQYQNTVRDLLTSYELDDLLPEVEDAMARIPADSMGDAFRRLDDRIAIEHVQGYFDVGVLIGDAFIADEDLLHRVADDCASDASIDDTCWEGFVEGFLTRVHRHPLSEDELELYDALREQHAGPDLIRAATIVALSSPRFLYQPEVDGEPLDELPDVLEVDAYELAARLSYTFWQTMPDDELFEAATSGSLLKAGGYEEQFQRVWQDKRTQHTIEQFWNEWLRLEKFTGFETSRPAFQALTAGEHFGEEGHDHYADMVQEIFDLTKYFVFDEPGTLGDLLSTRLSVTPSEDLASLYGVEPWDGEGTPPTLDNRAGLLQRAALLVSNLEQTNPFHRGALVRRQLFCDPLPQPDSNDLPPGSLDPPASDEEQTTRARFAAKVEGNGLCEDCHASFSDIGYVMESFDAVGRFRTKERVFDEQTGELLAELPIDPKATVEVVGGEPQSISDAAELNAAIIESGKVEACVAQKFFIYFSRRSISRNSMDTCVIDDLEKTLADRDQGIASAFKRMAEIPTFFTRKVGEP